MKDHAFGDLNELNLEPYVTLRALPASSLGSYPTLKHKIRQNLVSVCWSRASTSLFGELTLLLRNRDDSKPGKTPSVRWWSTRKDQLAWRGWAGLNKDQRWPPPPPLPHHRVGVTAPSSSSLTQPFIPAAPTPPGWLPLTLKSQNP